MQVLSGLDSLGHVPDAAALSVGNFDGVHLGHRRIIDTMRGLNASAVVVVTFEPHPLSVLRPELMPPRLTPPGLKHELLKAAGVTHLVELRPTPETLGVSAEDFWQMLRDDARPAHLVEGPDFTYGKGAAGNVDTLRARAADSGVSLRVVEPLQVTLPGHQIVSASSSLVRWMLVKGRVKDAAALLGRPYALRGVVVHGYERGRTIGYPTANLDVGEQLIPADGVYASIAVVDGVERAAALSIGSAPTFVDARRQVEAFLLDFSGDLYGKTIDLRVTSWVRDQLRFPGVESLIERMKHDVQLVAARCA